MNTAKKTRKKEILTLRGYYDKLRKSHQEFIKQIAKETGKTERTVWNWIDGSIVPDKSDREKIVAITGIEENKLFNLPLNEN